MWNSSFAVLWNKSSETDFCRIHWVEWEQTHRVLYLRECWTLLCVLKTICKSTKFCFLLWLKKYGFCAIAAEFWMPWKDHPSLCLTIHGCGCVCVHDWRKRETDFTNEREGGEIQMAFFYLQRAWEARVGIGECCVQPLDAESLFVQPHHASLPQHAAIVRSVPGLHKSCPPWLPCLALLLFFCSQPRRRFRRRCCGGLHRFGHREKETRK